MISSQDPPLETLLQNPRVTQVLLDMNAGLAEFCEREDAKGAEAAKAADRYRKLYRKRVGIEYSERKAVQEKVDQILDAKAGS